MAIRRKRRILPLVVLVVAALAGCGGTPDQGPRSGGPVDERKTSNGSDGSDAIGGRMTLYTCADDRTVKAVIGGFEKRHPAVEVDLFRAPTGQLNARIAADERAGGTKADVIWACDPRAPEFAIM